MRAVIFASAIVKVKTLLEAERDKHSGRTTQAGATSAVATRTSSTTKQKPNAAVSARAASVGGGDQGGLEQRATARIRTTETSERSERSIKPPLKWAGGKRWLVPDLAKLWQPHSSRRYVEPFCGGLAASLGLRPKRAILNDINSHLINFYTHLQRGLKITIEMKNEEKTFYEHRSRFNKLIKNGERQSAEAAQLFYYLNRTCFNGLCRFNKSGEFNVPFGTHKSIAYAPGFAEYKPLLKNWTFINSDIESLRVEPADFIYADPPYDVLYSRTRACV